MTRAAPTLVKGNPMVLTPGAYLRHRREAALLSIGNVADMFHTQPRWSELERIDWLQRIECDVEQPTFRTLVALRACFNFDLDVLGDLVAIAHGGAVEAPRLCRICACSERDACPQTDNDHHGTCSWVDQDLCSVCATPEPPQPGDPVVANDANPVELEERARAA